MANPQIENGHTQIANELLENLVRTHLSPNEWQVLLCIVRKTYGFHKKVDHIANCQMVEATGLCKAVISRVIRGLEGKKMITRQGNLVGFQKDWERWEKLAELQTPEYKEPPKMRIVRSDGYIGIWKGAVGPEFQAMATKQGYILEHRLVKAQSLGRCLESWEIVHHKGKRYPEGSIEDKQDNLDDNLELLPSRTEHMPSILAQERIHQLEARLAELQTQVDGKLAVQSTIDTKVSSPVNNEKLAIPASTLAISASTLAISSTKVSSPRVTQKIKDTYTKETLQKIYGEFSNVNLSDEQYQKLVDKFGENGAKEQIENLSTGMAAKPKKYKYDNHYAAILKWSGRDGKLKEGIGGKTTPEHSRNRTSDWPASVSPQED